MMHKEDVVYAGLINGVGYTVVYSNYDGLHSKAAFSETPKHNPALITMVIMLRS